MNDGGGNAYEDAQSTDIEIDTTKKPIYPDVQPFFILSLKGDSANKYKDLVSTINEEINSLDFSYTFSDSSLLEKSRINREAYLKALERIAGELQDKDTRREPASLLKSLWRARGAYDERKRLIDRPQLARLTLGDESATLEFDRLPHDSTLEQENLRVEIERALTVIDVVLERRRRSQSRAMPGWLKKISSWFLGDRSASHRDQRNLKIVYLKSLKDIADEGLTTRTGTSYAQRRLETFKESFVAREADFVKNQHVKALGVCTFSFAFLFLLMSSAIYFYLEHVFDDPEQRRSMHSVANFAMISTGACVGTWLSFSLRRVVLGFEDLVALEEDRLNPVGRTLFVVTLSCILGLLLIQEIVSISIGTHTILPSAPGMALLFGAICGIAERSLSSAVSRQAESIININNQPKGVGAK